MAAAARCRASQVRTIKFKQVDNGSLGSRDKGLDGFDGKILIISPVGPFLRRATGFQFQISNLRRPRNCCHKLHLQQPASADCGYKARNYFPAHSGCAVLPVTVLRILGQLEANNAIISWGNGYIYNKWSTMEPSKHHHNQKQ